MLKRLSILLFLSPLTLLAGSVDVRQETVEGMAVGTVNNNFRRLEKDKLDKKAVQRLLADERQKFVIVTDEKAAGTNGGTFTSGAWQKRTLNSGSLDIPGSSLAASVITLPAGTYSARISAPACRTDRHQAVLRNTTASADLVRGSSEFSGSGGDYACSSSTGFAVFALTATTTLELWHRGQTTRADYGFGIAGSFTTEQYSYVEILRLGD